MVALYPSNWSRFNIYYIVVYNWGLSDVGIIYTSSLYTILEWGAGTSGTHISDHMPLPTENSSAFYLHLLHKKIYMK